MAHLLYRLGEAALKPRAKSGKLFPPMITFDEAMKLREQFYQSGQKWPYEHLVPGTPQPPPGSQLYLERQKVKEQKREKRRKEIAEAMAKMPQMIAEYRASRKMDWSEVTPVDRLTMTTAEIREKYMRRRMTKQG